MIAFLPCSREEVRSIVAKAQNAAATNAHQVIIEQRLPTVSYRFGGGSIQFVPEAG